VIGDILVSPTAVDGIIQGIPASVHAHETRACGTPGSTVKKDKQWLVFAPIIRSMKAVPNMSLGRLQIQSRKIAPIVKIKGYGFDVDKSGLVLDGLGFRAMESTGV